MSAEKPDEARVLELSLHGRLVGYLMGFQGGRNVLSFANEFRNDTSRPTFSLTTHPNFPNAEPLPEPVNLFRTATPELM